MIERPPDPYQTDDGFRHLSAIFPALSEWNCLTVWRGSVAHGTYVPNDDPLSFDDKDLIGICIPPDEYYTGLREFGSRGTEEIISDPWDIVVYEHRKALRLLAKGNPNMLCMLWAPPEFTTHYTAAGEALLASRELFATQAAYPAFRGYAQSQLRKMKQGVYNGYMGQKRKALVDQFGYDTKNASHLIRILRQGIDFMRSGELEVYRSDAQELIEIKQGKFSYAEIRKEAERLDVELGAVGASSPLPKEPDWDKINELAVQMHWLQRNRT
jgi:predicted nucleotidyltransferase